MQIYIETAESTNNFYIDEVIGAVGGTSRNSLICPRMNFWIRIASLMLYSPLWSTSAEMLWSTMAGFMYI